MTNTVMVVIILRGDGEFFIILQGPLTHSLLPSTLNTTLRLCSKNDKLKKWDDGDMTVFFYRLCFESSTDWICKPCRSNKRRSLNAVRIVCDVGKGNKCNLCNLSKWCNLCNGPSHYFRVTGTPTLNTLHPQLSQQPFSSDTISVITIKNKIWT